MTSLPDSRLYTFIDADREFALYFLEGQRLMADLAVNYRFHGRGFLYFREVVLSVQPMIALLKHGEQFGFYVDSTDPEFYVKLETTHRGDTRCMIWPDPVRGLGETLSGFVRLQKIFPGDRPRYETVLEARDLPLRTIVNRVLADSYQVNSAVMVSAASDQSLLLHQLPPLAGKDDYELVEGAARARREALREDLEWICSQALVKVEDITAAFGKIGFRLLAHRPIRFLCRCSRERMIDNVRRVWNEAPEELFDPGQHALEITCEYCKALYTVTRNDLGAAGDTVH